MHRGHRRGKATSGNSIDFGEYGLKALEAEWITARQIEAARIAITRHLHRGGQVWVRLFSDKSVSKKPAETRMGGGKAAVDHWVAVVKPGRILFEVSDVGEDLAMEALRLASHKLPIATKAVRRDNLLAASSGE
jgi:large subunit ribosomal protein L16